MMKRFVSVLGLVALVVFAGVGPVAAQRATVVDVDPVRTEPLSQTVPVIGRLVAPKGGAIAAHVAGFLLNVRVRVGDRVARDDVLAELDTRTKKSEAFVMRAQIDQANAAVDSARAQLTLAKQELERQTRLKKSGAFARSRYDTAAQELIKAQAAIARELAIVATRRASLSMIELDIERATIRAPYDGVIIESLASDGAYLRLGDGVVRMLADRNLEIEAEVPSVRVAGLAAGVTVRAALDGGFKIKAVVRALLPVENPLTRTRTVRFKVDWPDGVAGLAHGQSVTVMVPVGAKRQVVTVHKDAIIRKSGGSLVFVVNDGKASPRNVQLGEATGSRIVVVSGLNEGDLAVVRGNERLRPGAAVTVNKGS